MKLKTNFKIRDWFILERLVICRFYFFAVADTDGDYCLSLFADADANADSIFCAAADTDADSSFLNKFPIIIY